MIEKRNRRGNAEVIVRALELSHAYGARVILEQVSFVLRAGQHIALVGPNGAGKTTLLSVLGKGLSPDAGSFELKPGLRVALLEQNPQFSQGASVGGVVQEALAHIWALERALRSLEEEMSAGLQDEAHEDEYARLMSAFERAGGYHLEADIARIFSSLELGHLVDREIDTLSGGERTRVALARTLIARPDLLLLDEPTNHLDVRMRQWLEHYLRTYPGTIVLVSHDRMLLDRVSEETWYLEHGLLERFALPYAQAGLERAKQRRLRTRQRRLGVAKLQRLEHSSGRVAAWGRNNARLARRARSIARRAERVRETLVEALPRERRIVMTLQAAEGRARVVLQAIHLKKCFAEICLFEDVALRVRQGDRVALIAPNGSGKTTLLRLLLGQLYSDDPRAEVRFADGAVPAWFDQDAHGLDPHGSILAQLEARVSTNSAKGLLGRFGFGEAYWRRLLHELSGGERARAGLALIAATRADVLVLDEPTNHLDVELIELLEEALSGYTGSILFVTHDREFARRVATRVMTIHEGKLIEFAGGFPGYERFVRDGALSILDPAGGFEPEPLPAPVDVRVHLETLEDRWLEIETVLEHYVGSSALSDRAKARLHLEAAGLQIEIDEYRAMLYASPAVFSLRLSGCTVLAAPFGISEAGVDDESASVWHFRLHPPHRLSEETAQCDEQYNERYNWFRYDQLIGSFVGEEFHLAWQDAPVREEEVARILLEGAASLAFEHLNVHLVSLPPFEGSIFAREGHIAPSVSREARWCIDIDTYVRWLGLMR